MMRTTEGLLSKDLQEFLETLNKHQVKYIVIGGVAVIYHGYARTTKDIDLIVEMTIDNIERTFKAIEEFFATPITMMAQEFCAPDNVLQMGRPPNRIDILTSAKGMEYTHIKDTGIPITIDGVSTLIIDLENLIANKKAVGRLQDLADVDKLEKIEKLRKH